MAAVAKSYGVGDTVYVWYKNSPTLQLTPQTRIVKNVLVQNSSNKAVVEFNSGESVTDNDPSDAVFTTMAACAKAIVDYYIAALAPTVVLDTATLSGASTAGLPATGLVRSA